MRATFGFVFIMLVVGKISRFRGNDGIGCHPRELGDLQSGIRSVFQLPDDVVAYYAVWAATKIFD